MDCRLQIMPTCTSKPEYALDPVSQAFREEFAEFKRTPLAAMTSEGLQATVLVGRLGVWLQVRRKGSAKIEVLLAYAPDGKAIASVEKASGTEVVVKASSSLGDYEIRAELKGPGRRVVHWQVRLTPSAPLRIQDWPRDLHIEAQDGGGGEARIHVRQHSTQGGVLFAELIHPEPAVFFYLQDLTSLSPYFEATRSAPNEAVGGVWPTLGFQLPDAKEALPEHREVVVSSAFLMLEPGVATLPELGLAYLRCLAKVYPHMELPLPVARDWPLRIGETIKTLTHASGNSAHYRGKRYLLPYVGADERPPESMVQLAVLVPLAEYAQMKNLEIPLVEMLASTIPTFWDAKAGSILRWLPESQALLNHGEEHMGQHIIDSWYLYHVLHNLARLAALGYETAREYLLRSVPYAIDIAMEFGYRWPIFFHALTKEVIKAESEPGQGGEHDVGGLYALLMLRLHELTGEGEYLAEAERGIRHVSSCGFGSAYQLNNTAYSAEALVRLWKATGDETFREQSYLCLANMFAHAWLWQSKYGHGKHYMTFMGIAPLPDAPYLAMFEDMEVLSSFHEYLELHPDAPEWVRLLLSEFCRYAIDRCWTYYPSELPNDAISDKPKNGHVDRRIPIPLEDIYEGWQQAGQVGQEVYGAAAPFIFHARHCHQQEEEGFSIQCEYPHGFEISRTSRVRGVAKLTLRGSEALEAAVRIIPLGSMPLPHFRVEWTSGSRKNTAKVNLDPSGFLEAKVAGDAVVTVRWFANRPRGAKGASSTMASGEQALDEVTKKRGKARRHFADANRIEDTKR